MTMLDKVKMEHDLAKAVKDDDAQVPVYLWDKAVCGREPADEESKALSTLCCFLLRLYQRWLLREIRVYMLSKFGPEWLVLAPSGDNRGARLETQVMEEILWWAAENEWFEYLFGSTLLYFRFPSWFRSQALEGVRVYYTDEGPTSKRRQPPVGEEEKQVLHKKIRHFINRRYIVPIPAKFELSIKYFAVPKGNDNWRIVFHAGANKLNERVKAPLFCLPSINSLLRIIDGQLLMSDQDMGDMVHNFPLHVNILRFTAIDLAPLEFGPEDCTHRWVCWKQNLMRFRLLPYNSVWIYLVAEETIRGDWHDHINAFQWNSIMLNLPGTPGYQTSTEWISKRRADNLLASNMVYFVDDQHVTGSSEERVREAGHTLSTRESYLGLQETLRKVRAPKGVRQLGAWARANVYIGDNGEMMVLTSLEKWEQLKTICSHWLGIVSGGGTDLDFKRLCSNQGYLVYVAQAYPGMKPYLKGFNLLLQIWRELRDKDGREGAAQEATRQGPSGKEG